MQSTELDRDEADGSAADANRARPRAAGKTTCAAVDGAQASGASQGAAHTALEAAFPIAPATPAAVVSVHVQEGPYHFPATAF